MINLAGKTLGAYEILAFIGRGGMSTVYKARQVSLGREVAIKVLNERAEPESPFLERFTREARIIAGLQHPHILPIYDYGQIEDFPYLVMRFVDGGSLNTHLSRAALPLEEIERLLIQICSALDYAHSLDVVHRDIKPHNVLLDGQRNAYLCDFGIAKVIHGHNMTRTGETVGTPSYMAPEQWQGLSVSPATDVYSVGVMLFEMLAGGSAFKAENVFSLMYKHLHEMPPPVTSRRPDLPTALDGVLMRALSKIPDDRYASAGELARAFTSAVRGAALSDSGRPTMIPVRAATVAELPAVPADADAPTDVIRMDVGTGRAWVMDAFERWLASDSPIFYLVGPHGIGKSTLLKRFADRLGPRLLRYELVAAQARSLDPRAFMASLINQLAALLPDAVPSSEDALHDILSDAVDAFDNAVLTPLSEATEPVYLVLDGLDAAFDHPGATIADLVRAALKNWPAPLRMIVSAVKSPRLEALFRNARRLEMEPDSDQNRADLRATLSTRFATLMPNLSGGAVDLSAMVEKAHGNPLYLTVLLDSLGYHRIAVSELPELPAGLDALYSYIAARLPEKDAIPLLQTLAVARAPLLAFVLADIWRESPSRAAARLVALRPLVTDNGPDTGWTLAHPSMRDWLLNAESGMVSRIHLQIAEALSGDPGESDPAAMSLYALQHLPAHYVLANRPERAFDLLTDPRFLTARLERLSRTEIIDDFGQVSIALSERSGPGVAEQIGQLEAALDVVRGAMGVAEGDSSGLFAALYNGLAARLGNVPGRAERLEGAAARWPLPWLRRVWPLGQGTDESRLIWRSGGAAIVALAAGRAPGAAVSRLAGTGGATGNGRPSAWLAACGDGQLRLWRDGKLIASWIGHNTDSGPAALTGCALSSDGTLALSVADDGTARLWNLAGDQRVGEVAVLRDGREAGTRHTVTGCAFSPDGTQALTSSTDRLLRLWDCTTGAVIGRFQEHPVPVLCCAFAMVDGKLTALSGDADGTLRLWDCATGALRAALQKHRGALTSLAALPGGRPIAVSGATDGQVIVWDVRGGADLRTLSGATGGITAVAVGSAGEAGALIVTAASEDRGVRVWDVESAALIRRLDGHTRAALAVAISPEGDVLSGGLDGMLRQSRADREVNTQAPVEAHGAEVRGMAFSADSRRLLTGSLDRELRLWDVETGTTLTIIKGHTGGVTGVALRPDGRVALSAAGDRSLRTWDTARGTALKLLTGHGDSVLCCAFGTKPQRAGNSARAVPLAVSGSADRTIRVWDADAGQTLLTLKGHRDAVAAVAFSAVDDTLLSASRDRTARLWSLADGALIWTYEADAALAACAISPDGRFILLGGEHGALILLARGEGSAAPSVAWREASSESRVAACGFSANGLLFYSLSADLGVRLWDARKQAPVTAYASTEPGGGTLTACAFAPDNAALALGDGKGKVILLRLEGGASARRKTSLL